MNKDKLIELRCKAWGITEDEYYCNQCSDFSLEDMARAYRRGKNKGRADIAKENAELKSKNKWYSEQVCNKECAEVWGNLTKAKEIIKEYLRINLQAPIERNFDDEVKLFKEAEQFLSEVKKC